MGPVGGNDVGRSRNLPHKKASRKGTRTGDKRP